MTKEGIIQHIIEKTPSIEDAPQEVKDVYQSAIDFFGEDRVDLQKNMLPDIWDYIEFPLRLWNLLKYLGVDDNVRDKQEWSELRNDIRYDYNDLNIPLIRQEVTTECLLKSEAPLYSIVVHFHDLTITNERNESTVVEDIYVNVPIKGNGTIFYSMYWSRPTFSELHYISNYTHSHLYSGNNDNWKPPCLGQGPIVMTIATLQKDNDIHYWNLFWLELSNCIGVESLEGVPYRYIRNIMGNSRVVNRSREFVTPLSIPVQIKEKMEPFLYFILKQGNLEWVYQEDHLTATSSFIDFTFLASNLFFEYLETLETEAAAALFASCKKNTLLSQGRISSSGEVEWLETECISTAEVAERPSKVFFKGEYVPFKVIHTPEEDKPKTYNLLHLNLISYLHLKTELLANALYAARHK